MMAAVARIMPAMLLSAGAAAAQTPARPRLRAAPLSSDLRLDGRLDEAAWASADSIVDLTQVEPVEGGVPSARTVVKVLADADVLVIGVVAYDPDTAGIVSFSKRRDASLRREDHVKIVLDTFLDGRSGYVFAVNPSGARYDALVADRGEGESPNWDAAWEAATARKADGWSVEIRIPVRSLSFARGLRSWGFNVQRRVQRLQETSRWASPKRDYGIAQSSRAGLLTELPDFRLGVGLSVRPALTAGGGRPAPGGGLEGTLDPSLDLTERLGSNLTASLTVNTDFAETEVDARRTNLTRFPLFFPEKRTFFLEGSDIFDFGLGLRTDVVPYFSRRIGLLEGREVPIVAGAKLDGRVGGTNLGALVVHTDGVEDLTPATTMGVVRVKQNVLAESSLGMIATLGDPRGLRGSWLAGADFTFQTSRFRGDKNFLVGLWGLTMDREGLSGDRTAAGLKIDYPNDLWDVSLTYKRIGDDFQPSLGFVPRPGVRMFRLGLDYSPRPDWRWVRQMFFEFQARFVTDLDGRLESYRIFTAPVNWRLESGDRFELNIVPTGERLDEPFEIADGVVIPPGSYDWWRFRLEAGSAAKRALSGQVTWWFGSFYGGTLHQIELTGSWTPVPILTLELNGEDDIGSLPFGDFTQLLVGLRVRINFSPDLELSSFIQYDNETRLLGSNTRLRWTFLPLGDLFVVYNHNVRDTGGALRLESNQLLLKAQYAFRY
jgi:hypothetical protein